MRDSDCALWIIDPSLHNPEDQGVEVVLEGWPGSWRVFRPVLAPGDGPRPGDGYDADGVVVLGSAASVHDRSPWIEDLGRWLDPLLAGGPVRPVLGICFGHQLLAWRAGGGVDFLAPDRAKRVGVESSRLEGGRLLPGRRDLRVVVSHREVVRRPPAGYRVVARRPGVDADGLEHETRPVFSFQFHPEAREEFADRAGIERVLLDDRLRADSASLLAAFRTLVLATDRRSA